MRLSKYEKETILLFNEEEELASIYTFNAGLKRRLAEFSRKYPECCRLKETSKEGSATYLVDKARISIRLTAPYSVARKKAISEYARKNGFQSERRA